MAPARTRSVQVVQRHPPVVQLPQPIHRPSAPTRPDPSGLSVLAGQSRKRFRPDLRLDELHAGQHGFVVATRRGNGGGQPAVFALPDPRQQHLGGIHHAGETRAVGADPAHVAVEACIDDGLAGYPEGARDSKGIPPGLPLVVPLGGKGGLIVGNRLCPNPSE